MTPKIGGVIEEKFWIHVNDETKPIELAANELRKLKGKRYSMNTGTIIGITGIWGRFDNLSKSRKCHVGITNEKRRVKAISMYCLRNFSPLNKKIKDNIKLGM